MTSGRPSKYTPELVEKAREYVNGGYEALDHEIPSHAGLALHLGINRDTLYAWRKDPEKAIFSDILDDCMHIQESRVISRALRGDYNATIAKLLLGKHGYTERQESTLKGDAENPLSVMLGQISGATLEPKSED